MFKSANVVILPTKRSNMCLITFSDREKEIKIAPNRDAFIYQKDKGCTIQPINIFITSDEEIKEGDWYINSIANKVFKFSYGGLLYDGINKKVIATNNTSLGLSLISKQFIQQYIEEYNKGRAISEVEVEYDLFWDNQKYKHQPFPDEFASKKDRVYDLKINPDNTINIKPIKNIWNREEVIELINKFNSTISDTENYSRIELSRWIEETL